MKLGELLTVLHNEAVLPQEGLDREVFDIAHDSRKVRPGSLFVAVRGFHSDGHQFIPQAVQAGAVAIVAEKGHNEAAILMTPMIVVDDSRIALAFLAAAFYGNPSQKLILIGITGTNGKTTTTYLIKSIIETAGRKAGLIGTIDYRVVDKVYAAPNTTPESLDLQRLLAEMVGYGVEYCVMEVSSHALALGRTVGCEFAVAGFTNLTQDHLDFHESMESYFRVKLLLFVGLSPNAFAVINSDDVRATEIIGATRAKVLTTGLSERADIRPSGSIGHGIRGLSFSVATPSGSISVESPLVGRHNIYNILSAIGIATALGFAGDDIARGISAMRAVPGRMEKVDEGQPFTVVADYAHTEDALVRLLETVREITTGKVITVFGCGGDRDRSKRPKMGAAAVNRSDIVIVTSDNPRTEDPLSIIGEIEKGMQTSGVRLTACDFVSASAPSKTPYCVMPDRHAAIAAAINMAGKGDVVVLAGKGHEDYQIIGDRKIHFDDREVAREELRKRRRT
jgi:UDP-N-acetylmuramoyl-L-alanyl-D-glutamate--2,6-diaminopimelate ligase